VKIATRYQYKDFKRTVFYHLLSQESPTELVEVQPKNADLVIYGPFSRFPKIVGRFVKRKAAHEPLVIKGRQSQPVSVYHTIENTRHNNLFDYSVGFDFPTNSSNFRFPYWMESIDWSHEGVSRPAPLRVSQYFKIEKLQQPLGNFLSGRNGKCAAFFGQLSEPRKTILEAVQNAIDVDGFGPAFDSAIKNSQSGGNFKDEVLAEYSFNLCPENGLFPGYYTEKILEAFASGCLPLTWVEKNVSSDFNPDAFVNLLDFAPSGYKELRDLMSDPKSLDAYKSQSLLHHTPSIEPLRDFVKQIVSDCL
jgi:hypothetical protein